MVDSNIYSVVLSGNLKSGFETEQVIDAFARLFKLPPEKASRIIGTEFVIKREVGLPIAKTYQEKLANIGIEVVVKQHGAPAELELAPIEPPPSSTGGDALGAPLGSDEMICPKCELRQARADECSGCGVIISKVPPPPEFTVTVEAEEPPPPQASAEELTDTATRRDAAPTATRWLIASIAVVAIGALAWYAIA